MNSYSTDRRSLDTIRAVGLALLNYCERQREADSALLFPRQLEVYESLATQVSQGKATGAIVLPTGAGKSVLGVEVSRALLEREPERQIWIVATEVAPLLSFQKAFASFAPEIQLSHAYGNRVRDNSGQVVLTTYGSLKGMLQKDGCLLSRCIGMLHDEVDQTLGPKRSEQVRDLFKRAPFHLGLTATDAYSEERTLEPLFGPNYLKMTYADAARADLIAEYKTFLVATDIDLSGVGMQGGDYSAQALTRALLQGRAAALAVQLYMDRHESKRVCCHCATVAHAEYVAKQFRKAGIPAHAVSHNDNLRSRARKISDWEKGKVPVIAAPRLLTRSYHDNSLQIVYNLYPTLSPVLEAQRSGRVLARDSKNPEKIAEIYDFVFRKDGKQMASVLFAAIAGGARIRRSSGNSGAVADRSQNVKDRKGVVPLYKIFEDSETIDEFVASVSSEVPEGWMSRSELESRCLLSKKEFEQAIKEHAAEIASLQKSFRSSKSTLDTYYAPEVLTLIHGSKRIELDDCLSTQTIRLSVNSDSDGNSLIIASPLNQRSGQGKSMEIEKELLSLSNQIVSLIKSTPFGLELVIQALESSPLSFGISDAYREKLQSDRRIIRRYLDNNSYSGNSERSTIFDPSRLERIPNTLWGQAISSLFGHIDNISNLNSRLFSLDSESAEQIKAKLVGDLEALSELARERLQASLLLIAGYARELSESGHLNFDEAFSDIYVLAIQALCEPGATTLLSQRLAQHLQRLNDQDSRKPLLEALPLVDTIEDENWLPQPEIVALNEMRLAVQESLSMLSLRDEYVLKFRYGLADSDTLTPGEVGRIFRISIEQARRVEALAIRKLQHPARAARLWKYLKPDEGKPVRKKKSDPAVLDVLAEWASDISASSKGTKGGEEVSVQGKTTGLLISLATGLPEQEAERLLSGKRAADIFREFQSNLTLLSKDLLAKKLVGHSQGEIVKDMIQQGRMHELVGDIVCGRRARNGEWQSVPY